MQLIKIFLEIWVRVIKIFLMKAKENRNKKSLTRLQINTATLRNYEIWHFLWSRGKKWHPHIRKALILNARDTSPISKEGQKTLPLPYQHTARLEVVGWLLRRGRLPHWMTELQITNINLNSLWQMYHSFKL